MSGITHMLLGPTVVSGGEPVVDVVVDVESVGASAFVGTINSSILTPWNINNALYTAGSSSWNFVGSFQTENTGNLFSVNAQETAPRGVFFKDDGTKMYIIGLSGDDINEYSLSAAWLVNTATFVQNFSVAAQQLFPTDIFFKPDGTKVYIVGTQNDFKNVDEYDLSTAWNISTASHVQSFSVAAQDTIPQGLFFKYDGTKLYVLGGAGKDVNEYDLSTAWDISTATFLQLKSVSAQETNPTSLSFKSDGTKMYVLGAAGDDVNQYSLSTAWDISTATFDGATFVSQDSSPQGLFIVPDSSQIGIGGGSAFYMVGNTTKTVYQYSVGGFRVASQETVPTDISFKTDGTKMYIMGTTGDDINEYNLSTAWDINTATIFQLKSIAAQETFPSGLYFRDDGLKAYVTGTTGDDVNEYNLSTAWNISTLAFVQNFSVAAQDTFPTGIFFKYDGTKMYITGSTGKDVNEYDLSTAWDISTASYLQNFSISAQTLAPRSLFFRDNGTKMYIIDDKPSRSDSLLAYSLSSAWDISTASYDTNFPLINQGIVTPRGLFWRDNGEQFFILADLSDRVYDFRISSS